jgi:hypothetical protein
LSQNQHGFWENRSTETACQNFVGFIQKKLDNGQHVIGIFFDLSKAYDVINHEILLDKLDRYGIRGKTKLWLESNLSYRSQYVEMVAKIEDICNQNYKSTCKAIKHGVPQGSILGPLLFLLYINDFPQYIPDTKVVLFADDINIVLADKDVTRLQDKVKNTMKQIESWFLDNKMIINVNKSKAIFFHLKNKKVEENPHTVFKNEKIGYISTLNFLGIHISASF